VTVGPLRRLAGALGLLALAPTAAMLAANLITPADAAVRAVVTLLGTMLVARVVSWWLALLAGNLERSSRQVQHGTNPVAAPTPGHPAGDRRSG
jgi:hypothetical protein